MSYSRPLPSPSYQEAQRLHQRGDLHGAERAYKQAISENANDSTAWQMLGVLYYQRKMAERAFECFEKSLTLDPANIEARINFAVMLQFEGRLEESVEAFNEVLRRDPVHAEALHMKGFVLNALGRIAEAATALRLATQSNAHHPGAWFQLGNALSAQGLWEEALPAFRRATELDRNNFEAWNNLGNTLIHLGQIAEAEEVFRRAHQLQPKHGEVLTNFGATLLLNGKTNEAGPILEEATQLAPKSAKAWFTLAQAQVQMKWLERSVESLTKTIELDPNNADAIRLQAVVLTELGLSEQARATLDDVTRRGGELSPSLQAIRALCLPVIAGSREEMEAARERVLQETRVLAESGLKVADPSSEIGVTGFYLSYYRDRESEHMKAIAEMHLALCPDLNWEAPHLQRPAPTRSRIRLGICSGSLHKHSVGRVIGPMIPQLDKEKFEIVVFHTGQKKDAFTDRIDAFADKSIRLPMDHFASRKLIANEELDMLFYPDIGMDAQTYFLAFSRLAPIQFTTWGHPVTTGIPSMDYYLSSEALETPESDAEYTEKLVRLPLINSYFTPPPIPANPKNRAELGLPENKKFYGCPQSLFKLHPDFDDAVANLLRRDPNGVVVFVEAQQPNHGKLLRERLVRSHPDVSDRILFLPMMPLDDYLSLTMVCDAILDPFYFGGGTTSLEIFAMGRPIVTMPGQLLRSRITRAEYAEMGFTELLADSPEAYVEMAYRLANDLDWQKHCRDQIVEKAAVLFESDGAVKQLEEWVLAVGKESMSS
ncbi:MAG: tetratricopeptide repeat protein [Fimbriimonadaceae bacterium]|nr:tetratricopeptide repeat protein [Fimbriimonadaceae bacterium]